MTKWSTGEIGKYLEVQNGYAFKSEDFTDNGEIPVIKIKNVASGTLNLEDAEFYQLPLDNLERYIIKKNDILIAMTGSHVNQPSSMVGRIARYSEDNIALLNQRVGKLYSVDEEELLEDFIYYFFRQEDVTYKLALSAGGSANQANISPKLIKSLEFSKPPIKEQRAIAGVLGSLDDKIDLLQRQNKTLEGLAQTLFRHWFVDGAEDDWEVVTIGDFTEINRASIGSDHRFSEIEYLDTGSITEGKIAGFQLYDLKDAPSRAKRLVQHNDLVISTVRPNQKHYGIIKNPKPNMIVSTGFCVLTCNKIDPHFVYILLTQPDMTEYLHIVAEGSTSAYPSLKPSDIGSVEFQLPPQDKLNAFAHLTRDLWAKIDENDKQTRTLEKLRDALLPKLMSGEVRVRV